MNLINQSNVRRLLLEQAQNTRAHKFTRVSKQTLLEINDQVRRAIVVRVQQLPSKGTTI